MTRKSKRELTSAVSDLSGGEDAGPVEEWLARHFREMDGAKLTFGGDIGAEDERETDAGPEVCICRSRAAKTPSEVWTSRSEIPDWIDIEADLPVER